MSALKPNLPPDKKVSKSYFKIINRGSTLRLEILAGITTFLTMAYAFVLIPTLLSQGGVEFGAAMTATVLAAVFATVMAALFANYPFALAPGVALIVYFSHVLITIEGLSWQVALGTCFLTGVVLWILTTLKLRTLLISTIPATLRIATIAGIGIFLAIVGLKNAGILVHSKNMLSFGNPSLFIPIMTAIGLVATGFLMRLKVHGAIFFGILLIWILSAAFGKIEWHGWMAFPKSLTPTLFQLDVVGALRLENLGLLISMIFIALFDSAAAVLALAARAGFIYKKKEGCDVQRIFVCDSTGVMLSAILGTSPIAVYLESAAGIGIGGRTGVTALVCAILFCTIPFFAPLITSIPLYATAPALIIIGGSMLTSIGGIKWKDVTEWIPAFLTLILIPFTFNVSVGIGVGYITFCALKLITGRVRHIHWFTWIIALLFCLKFAL